jgi:hypothetical protein
MIQIIQTQASNSSLTLATHKRMSQKPSTLLVAKLWGFVLSALVQCMKMACGICAKEILAQKKPVISKLVRLFCNKKSLLSKYKNCSLKVKQIY